MVGRPGITTPTAPRQKKHQPSTKRRGRRGLCPEAGSGDLVFRRKRRGGPHLPGSMPGIRRTGRDSSHHLPLWGPYRSRPNARRSEGGLAARDGRATRRSEPHPSPEEGPPPPRGGAAAGSESEPGGPGPRVSETLRARRCGVRRRGRSRRCGWCPASTPGSWCCPPGAPPCPCPGGPPSPKGIPPGAPGSCPRCTR